MSEPVIKIENLSKRYILSHQEETAKRYVALRDVIAQSVNRGVRKIARPLLRGRLPQDGQSATREEFWALKDVTLDIHQGDRLGIIGRNGAGKSTLLKILSRITEPTTGRITIKGRVASLLEVGTGFHPELTGRENIYLNGAILGMLRSEIRRKFDDIVEFAEVERFLDTPVKRYSSGMYVRLAFAVAAHLEPEILIVDEVLAVGDAQFQKKCLGKMEEVGKQGRTVLFVSHNMNAIEQLCGSCVMVEKGHIAEYSNDVRCVIRDYLFGQAEAENSNTWVNSGSDFVNPWFTPLRFMVTDAAGNMTPNPVRNDDNIYLQIEGEVKEPHRALALEYTVYSEDGVLVYHSSSIDLEVNPLENVKAGHVAVRTYIPKRFLNEGTYRIDLTVFLHRVRFVTQYGVNAPSIYLVIQGGLTDSKLWSEKRPGIMAPMLEWTLVNG